MYFVQFEEFRKCCYCRFSQVVRLSIVRSKKMVWKSVVLRYCFRSEVKNKIYFDHVIKVSAQIINMAESDDLFKGESLDILLDLIDEEALDDIFEEDINTVITEVGKYINKYNY